MKLRRLVPWSMVICVALAAALPQPPPSDYESQVSPQAKRQQQPDNDLVKGLIGLGGLYSLNTLRQRFAKFISRSKPKSPGPIDSNSKLRQQTRTVQADFDARVEKLQRSDLDAILEANPRLNEDLESEVERCALQMVFSRLFSLPLSLSFSHSRSL